MDPRMVLRSKSLAVLLLTPLTLSGCYSGYYLTAADKDSGSVLDHSNGVGARGFPAYISSAADEGESSPPYALARSLQSTGLYSAVYIAPPQGDFIEAKLSIMSKVHEEEQAANIAKMILTGASFFLLSGALPQTNHFDAEYMLDVTWPNHTKRSYTAHCGAYSYATIDKYRDVQRSAKELKQAACINSLTNQMSADYPRLMKGFAYTPPKGMTTGQLTQWGRAQDPNQAKPEAVCTEVGLTPGTKSYSDCLSELN